MPTYSTMPWRWRPYLTDWRGRFTGRARAVLRPGSAAELSELVARCHGRRADGSTGQYRFVWWRDAACRQRLVVISLGRLNRIRGSDAANNTLVVEGRLHAGCRAGAAAGIDRLFPLSLASEGSCQIGGNLSTNAGGVHVLRYGSIGISCSESRAVLPDGRLWNGLRGIAQGQYRLRPQQLFIGAEGTGIITAAVLAVSGPRSSCVAWVQLDSPALAVELLAHFQATAAMR